MRFCLWVHWTGYLIICVDYSANGVVDASCAELDALGTLFGFLRHGWKVLFAFYDNMLHLITTTD